MRTQEAVLESTKQQPRVGTNVKLFNLAKRCLTDADGDMRAAAEKLIAIMDAKPAIYRAALDKFKESAAYDAIRLVMRAERRTIAYQPSEASEAADAALAQVIERHWFDYPLANGMKMGDATQADLIAQAKIHELHERGNAIKRRFMEAVASRVPEGRTVRNVVTEGDIASLFDEAKSC